MSGNKYRQCGKVAFMNPEPSPDERFLTPATVMTLSRPLMAAKLSQNLIAGKGTVTHWMLAVGASDGEGYVARYMDKHHPEFRMGSTEIGKALDPIADTAAFLEISVAALKAPRVSKLGKIAVGIVLAGESVKTAWATWANIKHRRTTGEQLVIKPSRQGKIATAEKFAALTAAVATHDLKPGRKRTMLGILAVGTAIDGVIRGEKARREYNKQL